MSEFVLFFLLGAPVTLVLHELAHVVVILSLTACRVSSFCPYPHRHQGIFYIARVAYECDRASKSTMTPRARHISALAPLLKSVGFFSCWFAAGFLLYLPFFCLAFWEATDAINWIQGYVRRSTINDGGRFRNGEVS